MKETAGALQVSPQIRQMRSLSATGLLDVASAGTNTEGKGALVAYGQARHVRDHCAPYGVVALTPSGYHQRQPSAHVGSQNRTAKSVIRSSVTGTPSASSARCIASGEPKWCLPVSMPRRLTTRWQASPDSAWPAIMAQPTVRAPALAPR